MATLTINGSVNTLATGSSFRDAVVESARNAGYGKFRVYLNGAEIDPAAAPAIIGESDSLEIRPFEKAGR